MTDKVRELIKEEIWKRWHNANNLHLLVEQDDEDLTKAHDDFRVPDPTKVGQERPWADEPTKLDRPATSPVASTQIPDPTRETPPPDIADTDISGPPEMPSTDRRPVKSKDAPGEAQAALKDIPLRNPDNFKELTPAGRIGQGVNNVWNNALVQMLNFGLGRQVAIQVGQRLAQQTGIEPRVATQISSAVMKEILEELDEMVSKELSQTIPGIFERTRA